MKSLRGFLPARFQKRRMVCYSSEPVEREAFGTADVLSSTDELMTYSVSLKNEASEEGTTLKLSGKDRGRGLLSDVAFALASLELDVLMASIYTSQEDSELEDTFILQKNGTKVAESDFDLVEETVLAACLKSLTISNLPNLLAVDEAAPKIEGRTLQDVREEIESSLDLELVQEEEEEEGDSPMKWTFATVGSIALVNLAAALFGSNQVLIKITETEISPSTLNFLRFGIAALAFLPIGLKSGAWTKKQLRDTAMELSTYLFVGYTAQVIGLGMTSASRGAVMAEFAVLIVPLWAKLSGQKIPNLVWYCAAIALVGVAMVTSTGADGGFNQGDALCMLSACCFGTHVFRTEQRTATMDNKDLPGLISLELAMLTVLSGVYEVADFGLHNPGGLMAFDPQQTLKHLGELPWPNLALMGMGTTAFTLWIEITALQNISSTLASLIYTTEPLWGAFFAAICLKEKFGGLGYLGAFLIVSSTMYATVKGGITKETKKEKVA
jgi:drug/metabolite transporter (DMT)-like permease